ncbi:MAG: cysteine hydrolase [Rhodospirillales bacterium]|nr:cysteine hydrolase [Rhodospirillales bacterium]
MRRDLLLIIDVQQGFINPSTAHIPAMVEELQHAFSTVMVSRFFNPPGSPYRRLMEWEIFAPRSPEGELAFKPRDDAYIFDKAIYSALSPQVESTLTSKGINEVVLCGIATDNCILKTAVDLFENGYKPIVIADACASHGGPECHEAGLMLLKRFIGADQVIPYQAQQNNAPKE